jgi:hypothetical protein
MASIGEQKLILEYTAAGGTVTSEPIDMLNFNGIHIHQYQSSGPTGTLSLLESSMGLRSEDAHDFQNTGVSFTALSGTVSQAVNVSDVRGRWCAIKYTHTSGSGGGQVWITMKGNG